MTVILVACAAFVATLIGGSAALYLRDRLHLILGFSAGAVAGVALFDLLPESFALSAPLYGTATTALLVAAGVFGYPAPHARRGRTGRKTARVARRTRPFDA